jgi:ribosome-binding protein aMBF1 (putative translation factor)
VKNNTTNNEFIPKLAIKMNARINLDCPLCNQPTNANIGVEIVEDESNLPVCRECAIKHAVDLAYLISLADSARLLAISERDFGAHVERGMTWNEFRDRDNVLPFRKLEVAR